MTTETSTMFCMRCGRQLPPEACFCPNCGQKVETPSDAPSGTSAKPPKIDCGFTLAVIAVVVVAAAGGAFFFLRKKA